MQSRTIPAPILIKNPPIYRYTSDTKYFIENEEENTGSFSQNALYDYLEDDII